MIFPLQETGIIVCGSTNVVCLFVNIIVLFLEETGIIVCGSTNVVCLLVDCGIATKEALSPKISVCFFLATHLEQSNGFQVECSPAGLRLLFSILLGMRCENKQPPKK